MDPLVLVTTTLFLGIIAGFISGFVVGCIYKTPKRPKYNPNFIKTVEEIEHKLGRSTKC